MLINLNESTSNNGNKSVFVLLTFAEIIQLLNKVTLLMMTAVI